MITTTLYHHIRLTILEARHKVVATINVAMLEAYWQIGGYIVEEEQQGKHRAEYGKNLIRHLAEKLSEEFGNAYSERNLLYCKQFYHTFPIFDALRQELTWTHYRCLLNVENKKERAFYIQESIANHWSTRALDRQIKSLYYERLLSSQNRDELRKTGNP
ncbi:MAG TPA: DUF1016 N-terminal domain-containing protein [Chitinophagales bacterium]|nr:DUF1016 N-terminal domain-containing protein [Chitinophagales bacterium]